MPDLDFHDAQAIIDLPKQQVSHLSWSVRQNQANYHTAASPLLDIDGTTIPGLTVVLETRVGVFADECLRLYSIHKRISGTTWRVYQLEVCPRGKRSHNGLEGALFGPHEHIGTTVVSVADPAVHCGNPDACLAYFCAQAGLAPITFVPQ